VSAFRLPLIAVLLAVFLGGCADVPPGLEKQWARREAAQSDFDMCIHVHERSPSACSAARTRYNAALQAYKAAAHVSGDN
jgi:hypothetical protein